MQLIKRRTQIYKFRELANLIEDVHRESSGQRTRDTAAAPSAKSVSVDHQPSVESQRRVAAHGAFHTISDGRLADLDDVGRPMDELYARVAGDLLTGKLVRD
jgi:hypothetical protein